METLALKPNRTVAVTLQRAISTVISLFFGLGLIISSMFIPDEALFLRWIMLGIGTLILVNIPWVLYSTKVRYEKTGYTLEAARIVTTTGGPFSDSTTELEIRNVTHVKLVLPWIENKLFGTGAVHVESAGTGGVEAHLIYLDEPERVYGIVQKLMKQNGFALTSTKNLMETRASRLGALIDVLTGTITALFALLWVGGATLIPLYMVSPWLLLLSLPVLALVAFGFYVYYRNSVSKTYTITEDAITYDEGFLTKRKSIIPVENLSNSHINEPLLKRIFGVSDVLVSCQGSGSEIAFRNLSDAKSFDESISTLIDSERTTPDQTIDEHRGEVRAAARKRTERKRRTGAIHTTTYKPSIRPAFIGAIFIGGLAIVLTILASVLASPLGSFASISLFVGFTMLVIVIATVGLIVQAISIAITTYTIEQNRVKSAVDLFNRDEHSFSDDRLTRITLRRTVFDRIAKTVSVDFWSIGSGACITFRSIDEKSGIVGSLEQKYGLREPRDHLIRSEPRISTIIRANMYGVIAAVLILTTGGLVSLFWMPAIGIAAGIITIPALFIIVSNKLSFRNAYFAIDEKNLYETHGWFMLTQSFVNVEDIKGVTTTQYPFGSEGSITFNVAGEGVIKTDKGEHIIPNVITIPYLPAVFERSDAICSAVDEFAPPSEPIYTATLWVPRIVTPIMLIGIIIPLLPLAVMIALISALRSSRTRFFIEQHRIVREVQFFYPTRKVIFYDRIDHLNTSQGFFDKLFRTGVVQVTTTGSSRIEMHVGPTKDNLKVHEELDQAYR
jgi:membrane protein YdbS with pleckstrin-like domain